MPDDQNKHKSKPTSSEPDHSRTQCPSFPNYCYGFYCEITGIQWTRHDLNDYRSRLHEGSNISSLQRNHRLRRSGPALRHSRIPTLQHSPEDNLGPRYPVYLQLLKGVISDLRNQTEHQHRLPSTNGWTKRMHEPVAGTVSPTILRSGPKAVEPVATTCTVHKELMAIQHDQEIPIQITNGICATGTPTF